MVNKAFPTVSGTGASQNQKEWEKKESLSFEKRMEKQMGVSKSQQKKYILFSKIQNHSDSQFKHAKDI